MGTHRDYLSLEDDALLSQCRMDVMRGSGPGGQKRNKTSSAVRLVHEPTGIAVRDETQRSQKSNRKSALGRLRVEIALKLRSSFVADDSIKLNPRDPLAIGHVLDALQDRGYVIGDAARLLGITTGALSRFICAESPILEEVNRQRMILKLRALRAHD